MKNCLLVLVLCLGAAILRAEDMQVGGHLTGTVKIAGVEVPRDQVLVTPKADHVHILWDAFAERGAIKQAGKVFSLDAAALALAKTMGHAAAPKATLFKVDVAEFPVRDDYGAPRWDDIRFLGHFVVTRVGKRWVVKKRIG
jgi:hypothetical protein